MWDDSRHVSRQIPGIGSLLAERLAAAGIDQLRKLQEADPRRIETVTQRHYPFGKRPKSVSMCVTLTKWVPINSDYSISNMYDNCPMVTLLTTDQS